MPEIKKSPLQVYREAKGLTQHQLATILGVSQSFVANIENGVRPITPRKAIQWEAKIGVDRADLCPDIFSPRPARKQSPRAAA